MKHLLNNISEEEKNRIREQHEGGMNLSIDNFKKLVETKLGDTKPFLSEQEEVSEQNEDDVIRLIMDINTKLPDDLKSRMVIMKDFDDNQKVSFFERLMALAEKHFEKELNEQLKDDPNSKSTEKGYRVGPIPGTAHFKGMEFDVHPSPVKSDRIKLQSELRQSESLNIIEFDYSFAPTKSISGFVAPAEFNCNTKMLYLPYDSEGGKDAKNYAIGEKFSDMLTKFCYRTKK